MNRQIKDTWKGDMIKFFQAENGQIGAYLLVDGHRFLKLGCMSTAGTVEHPPGQEVPHQKVSSSVLCELQEYGFNPQTLELQMPSYHDWVKLRFGREYKKGRRHIQQELKKLNSSWLEAQCYWEFLRRSEKYQRDCDKLLSQRIQENIPVAWIYGKSHTSFFEGGTIKDSQLKKLFCWKWGISPQNGVCELCLSYQVEFLDIASSLWAIGVKRPIFENIKKPKQIYPHIETISGDNFIQIKIQLSDSDKAKPFLKKLASKKIAFGYTYEYGEGNEPDLWHGPGRQVGDILVLKIYHGAHPFFTPKEEREKIIGDTISKVWALIDKTWGMRTSGLYLPRFNLKENAHQILTLDIAKNNLPKKDTLEKACREGYSGFQPDLFSSFKPGHFDRKLKSARKHLEQIELQAEERTQTFHI